MMNDPHALAPTETETSPAIVAAESRDRHELQAAYTIAHHHPRNETKAFSRTMDACTRPSFAEKARYIYPRGNGTVEGPSVNLAREMARVWGNIRYGFRVLDEGDDWVHIGGFALDVESNISVASDGRYGRLIFRKNKGWIKPDEREYSEMINRHGAKLERNCILKLLPSDLVEEAMRKSKETIRKAASGEITRNREDTIRAMVIAFGDFAVTVEHIESKLGHPVADIDADELAELKSIYMSLKDGHTTRKDHFGVGESGTWSNPETGTVNIDDLTEGEPPERPGKKKDDPKNESKKAKDKKKKEEEVAKEEGEGDKPEDEKPDSNTGADETEAY